jgi:hypothetical protein
MNEIIDLCTSSDNETSIKPTRSNLSSVDNINYINLINTTGESSEEINIEEGVIHSNSLKFSPQRSSDSKTVSVRNVSNLTEHSESDQSAEDEKEEIIEDLESAMRVCLKRENKRSRLLKRKKIRTPGESPLIKHRPYQDFTFQVLANVQINMEKKIAITNKGYKMLKKMGYKEGQGIGKNSDGILEPLNCFDVKNNTKKEILLKREDNLFDIDLFLEERLIPKIETLIFVSTKYLTISYFPMTVNKVNNIQFLFPFLFSESLNIEELCKVFTLLSLMTTQLLNDPLMSNITELTLFIQLILKALSNDYRNKIYCYYIGKLWGNSVKECSEILQSFLEKLSAFIDSFRILIKKKFYFCPVCCSNFFSENIEELEREAYYHDVFCIDRD